MIPALSHSQRPNVFDAEPSVFPMLGALMTETRTSLIYEDRNDKNYLVKTLRMDSDNVLPDLHEECELFNRYYGAHSASISIHRGKTYLRMCRLPGRPLHEVNIFHEGAEVFFFSMLESMESRGIYHSDLTFDNVLYCAQKNRFYPVNMTSNALERLHASPPDLLHLHGNYVSKINAIVNFILNGSVQVQCIHTPPLLGAMISYNNNDAVYLDPEDDNYVWKLHHVQNADIKYKSQLEACHFNRYYGRDAATIKIYLDRVYTKMIVVPGLPIKNAMPGAIHKNSFGAFCNMVSAITNAELSVPSLPRHLYYDAAIQRSFIRDNQDHYHNYFRGSRVMAKAGNNVQRQIFEKVCLKVQEKFPCTHPHVINNNM